MKKFQERIPGLSGSVGTLSAILLLFFSLHFSSYFASSLLDCDILVCFFFLWASFLLYASNFFFFPFVPYV